MVVEINMVGYVTGFSGETMTRRSRGSGTRPRRGGDQCEGRQPESKLSFLRRAKGEPSESEARAKRAPSKRTQFEAAVRCTVAIDEGGEGYSTWALLFKPSLVFPIFFLTPIHRDYLASCSEINSSLASTEFNP